MPTVATIGAYDWTVEAFFAALRTAHVGQLLDVRQRRGVRGPEYAWANSVRLQAALAAAGIEYRHHRELAPTTELRRLQYREDAKRGVGNRARYTREILDAVDLTPIVAEMPGDAASALFCVERDPEACHRSIVAERLAAGLGGPLSHTRPGADVRPSRAAARSARSASTPTRAWAARTARSRRRGRTAASRSPVPPSRRSPCG